MKVSVENFQSSKNQTHIQNLICHQILLDVHSRRAINLLKHRRTDVINLQVLHRLRENVSCQESSSTAKVNSILKLFLDVKESIGKAKSNFFFYVIVSFSVVSENNSKHSVSKSFEILGKSSFHLFAARSF